MAVDLAGTITYLKDHAIEHGFHVHDERHFIETYTLRQSWEIDVHPEEACDGPLDLHMAIDVDPQVLLRLGDLFERTDEVPEDPQGVYAVPFLFNWSLPPLDRPPDLIVLSTELAAIGGVDLPVEVSAVDSFGALADGEERRLSLVGKVEVSLVTLMFHQERLCDVLDRVHALSMFLVDQAPGWMSR
ncbi:MAG TPA: hypothetical protein ENK55_06645 [Actinobacteria bacterium]|nr:hypothetical protein [Actinomycetota bacterium]